MAFEGQQPVKLVGAIAGSGISAAAAQYKFVKLSADNTVVLCDGATDVPIGVLQAPIAAGGAADVVVVGETKVQADASLTAGQLIGTSADGQADRKIPGTDTTEYVVGVATVVAGGPTAGNLITAIVNCASPGRAA